jgi:hypothetical protein
MSSSRGLLVGLVAAGLAAALGCSGLGTDATTPPTATPPARDKLKVGPDDGMKRGERRTERPDDNYEAGIYVVKLNKGYAVSDLGLGRRGGAGGASAGARGAPSAKSVPPGGKAGKGGGKARGPGGGGGGGGGGGRGGGAGGDDGDDGGDPVMRNPVGDPGLGDYLGLGRMVRIRSTRPKEQVLAKFEAMDAVEWIEPATKMRNSSVPNDPYFQYQWHMQMLKVPEAWQVSMGQGAVVAVVDSGVNAGEDGFGKLLPGHDFVDNDDRPDDLNGHGTHVAGTIAQATNNGVGVAGVAPRASILPVRVLDASGSGSNTNVANGIVWAADHGADVINMSLGSAVSTELIADAIAYAYEKNVTIVAATGNDGNSDQVSFPAAYDNVIGVGSIDEQKQIAFYSNQGKEVDLVAPGGDTGADDNHDGYPDGVVQETQQNGVWSYYYLQGTSMASPHVAGCAALVWAHGVHDPDQIARILNSTATDLGAKGWDSTYGNGLVNPVAALQAKGGQSGRGELAITNSRVRRGEGGTRAMVGWLTNVAANTTIQGSDGFHQHFDAEVKQHRVTVRGQRGKTVTYTMRSSDGKKTVTDTVTVKF